MTSYTLVKLFQATMVGSTMVVPDRIWAVTVTTPDLSTFPYASLTVTSRVSATPAVAPRTLPVTEDVSTFGAAGSTVSRSEYPLDLTRTDPIMASMTRLYVPAIVGVNSKYTPWLTMLTIGVKVPTVTVTGSSTMKVLAKFMVVKSAGMTFEKASLKTTVKPVGTPAEAGTVSYEVLVGSAAPANTVRECWNATVPPSLKMTLYTPATLRTRSPAKISPATGKLVVLLRLSDKMTASKVLSSAGMAETLTMFP